MRVAFESVATQQISHYNQRGSKKPNGLGISWWGRATADTPRGTRPSAAILDPSPQSHLVHEVLRVLADSELLVASNVAAQRNQIALDELHQRGFSDSVRTHDRHARRHVDTEVHVLQQNPIRRIAERDVLDGHDGRRKLRALRSKLASTPTFGNVNFTVYSRGRSSSCCVASSTVSSLIPLSWLRRSR